MKIFRNKWFLIAIFVLVAGGGFWYWKADSAKKNGFKTDEPTVKVEKGRVDYVLHETGVVAARVSVQVRPKVSGKVVRLDVGEGAEVKSGQRLAVIEPDVNEALSVVQRRSRVNELRENYQQKERDLERSRQLAQQGFVSPQALEQATLDYENLRRQYELERLSLEAMERDYGLPLAGDNAFHLAPGASLPDYHVTAPISGVITELPVKTGELVTSGISGMNREGSHLMTIADITALDISCMISEVDVARLKIGQPVTVSVASLQGRKLAGKIMQVSLSGTKNDRGLVQFGTAVYLDEPNNPALKPGMSCTVDIEVDAREDVLRIPLTAFQEREGKAWVKMPAAKPGEPPAKKEVEIGLRGSAYVEVVSGLKEGDVILSRVSSEERGEPIMRGRMRRM